LFILFLKEIRSYFTSLTGYLIIGIYLILTSLLLWFFPDTSILENGYANLDVFFILSPYLFIFLIPALTMRAIAGEFSEGTFDLLRSRPLSIADIVLGKYFASLLLTLISIVPTLIYAFSIYQLAQPVGNIDLGAIVGSYIGLLLLGFSFCAIGIFCSSLSHNPVISFLLAAVLCFLFYDGFSALATIPAWREYEYFISFLGIKEHYDTVSRGVLSFSDFTYFVSVSFLFISVTLILLNRAFRTRKANLRLYGFTVIIIVLLNIPWFANIENQIDFTSDKRHTVSTISKSLLSEIDEDIYFTLFLDGKLPSDFERLKKATINLVKDFQRYAKGNIYLDVIDPFNQKNGDSEEWIQSLTERGLAATNLNIRSETGSSQRILFPGMIVHTKNTEIPVNLLQDKSGVPYEEVLNNSIENLEYGLLSGIQKVMQKKLPIIAFTEGNGEPEDIYLHDAIHTLALSNQTGRVNLDSISLEDITKLDVLIVAKPSQALSETNKYKIDHYVRHGGNIIWAIDQTDADLNKLRENGEQFVNGKQLNLDDLLFLYGVRINYDLIVDLNSSSIPLSVGNSSQIQLYPWYFYPVISPESKHPLVKNLGGIRTAFISSIDTLENNIHKEIILHSSPYSKKVQTGQIISLSMADEKPDPREFKGQPLPVAVLLEGNFPYLFENRPLPEGFPENSDVESISEKAKMLIMSDGDWLTNDLHPQDNSPYLLGWDKYTNHQFANKTFLLNAIDYLLNDEALIALRSRNIKLMLLDKSKTKDESTKWKLINIVLPILFLFLAGVSQFQWRKQKYKKAYNSFLG